MELKELKEGLEAGAFDERLKEIYADPEAERARILDLAGDFTDIFTDNGIYEAGRIGGGDVHVFSAPGRCEICGNHTDHQNGCVIAAAVDLDMIAIAAKNGSDVIRINSDGFGMFEADLGAGYSGGGGTEAIIFGMAKSLENAGFNAGGFDACVLSNIPEGAGVSSSAAFEILLGNIISGLFNDGKIDPVVMAAAAKKTENEYFNKPSGLMDQLSIAEGGLCFMDFKDPEDPVVEKIDADFGSVGYNICLVDTGSSHADLTEKYAEIPADMKSIAAFFHKDVLREVTEDDMAKAAPALMETFGERPFRRAIHFFNEEERVIELKDCFAKLGGDVKIPDNESDGEECYVPAIERILELLCRSGDSSFRDLQNVCARNEVSQSPMAKALDMSWDILEGRGAFRVHGGGFAGTIIAVVPDDLLAVYTEAMEEEFGKGSLRKLQIRKEGGCMLI